MRFERLFQPIRINGLEIKNRIVMPAMALFYAKNYAFNERFEAFYRERAAGGVGLMIIGPVAIDRVGSPPFLPGLFDDMQIEPFRTFLDELRRTTDVKVGIQLMHQGRCASARYTGVQPIAPSPIAYPVTGEVPREMTVADIDEVQRSFASAAIRARKAGFDYVEIIAAGGYLIGSFLSPFSNHRVDDYGGLIGNRMRFGLEVIRKVRNALGRDFPMGIRVSGHDYVEGGHTNLEAALFCSEAEKAGVDAIGVTGGWHETNVPQITSDVPPGAFVYLARSIKKVVGVPVFASNRLGDPVVAERVLRSGSADLVCWARPLLADPELPNKVRTGRADERVPCIACNQGCFDSILSGSAVRCTVNPRVGREADTRLERAPERKRIFVAGGGPAGMEFALTAAARGHSVTLFEKSPRLGGQVHLAGATPGKEAFLEVAKSLENRLHASNVEVRLETCLTTEMVKAAAIDVLVVASGAIPAKINVPGIDKPHVVTAWDVLNETVTEIGDRVVVVGGSATGCETALHLVGLGIPDPEVLSFLLYHSADETERIRHLLYETDRKVTVIEAIPRLATNVGLSTRWRLLKDLKLMGVELRAGAKLQAIEDGAVIVETESGTERIPADTVVIAVGARSVDVLSREVALGPQRVVTIGDAKEPRKLMDAIREGFDLGMAVSSTKPLRSMSADTGCGQVCATAEHT